MQSKYNDLQKGWNEQAHSSLFKDTYKKRAIAPHFMWLCNSPTKFNYLRI